MILVPLALYVVIALGARTLNVEDFFASGRRVPPVYNGAVLAAVLIGGTGFFAYTGTLFFLGFDALAIGLAWTAGLIVSGHPVRALLAQGRRLHHARLSRPALPLAFCARHGERAATSAGGVAACRRDQGRGPDHRDVPAALPSARRRLRGRHHRLRHHRRRHALAHLERERASSSSAPWALPSP